MGWDGLFSATSGLALAGWIALAFLSRGPKTMSLVLYVGVALLCLVYSVLFVVLVGKLVDPGLVAGPGGQGGLASIATLRALMASDGAIVLGWTHYLAFDLFVGLWIAKDADHKNFSRAVQLPFLIATLVAGPVGLFAWLLVRERRARGKARD
jgi:hypothetical protein